MESRAKLIFNRLLGKLGHSALAFDLQYTRQRLQGYYRQQPNNYDSFFFKSVSIEDLGQHESQFKWDAAFHGAYIARTLHHSYSVQLSASKTSNQLTNDIAANENTLPVYSDSGNNYQFQTEQLGIKLEDAWKCTDRFTLTGRLTAEKQWYSLRQLQSQPSSKDYSRWVWLPALFAELKLSQKDQLTISGTVQSALPDVNAMAPGYTINQLTVIRQGTDSFLMRTYPTAQLVFSHFAMVQHGFLFFTGISYSSNPYLTLPDQYPNSYYTYSRYQVMDSSGTNFSIFTRAEKFLPRRHMRIEPGLVFSAGRNYSMIDAIISQTRFQQYKAGVSGSITVGKIQTQAGSSYTLNRQQRQSASEQPGYINTAQWENKMKISWNISPRLFLDAQGLYNVLYPNAQKAQSILLADAELSYHFKNERWVVGCQATNLLDKRNFAESFVTPFSSVYNNYSLFHRVVLGYLRFSF